MQSRVECSEEMNEWMNEENRNEATRRREFEWDSFILLAGRLRRVACQQIKIGKKSHRNIYRRTIYIYISVLCKVSDQEFDDDIASINSKDNDDDADDDDD